MHLNKNIMTHDQKVNYMKIAAGVCGYAFSIAGLDLLISLYDAVIEKEGATDLRTISNIEIDVKNRDIERQNITPSEIKKE